MHWRSMKPPGGVDSSLARSSSFLVIVQIVYVRGGAIFQPEYDTPVGADHDRPIAMLTAFECMEPKTRQIHIRNRIRGVEPSQYVAQLRGMLPNHSARIIGVVEAL